VWLRRRIQWQQIYRTGGWSLISTIAINMIITRSSSYYTWSWTSIRQFFIPLIMGLIPGFRRIFIYIVSVCCWPGILCCHTGHSFRRYIYYSAMHIVFLDTKITRIRKCRCSKVHHYCNSRKRYGIWFQKKCSSNINPSCWQMAIGLSSNNFNLTSCCLNPTGRIHIRRKLRVLQWLTADSDLLQALVGRAMLDSSL